MALTCSDGIAGSRTGRLRSCSVASRELLRIRRLATNPPGAQDGAFRHSERGEHATVQPPDSPQIALPSLAAASIRMVSMTCW